MAYFDLTVSVRASDMTISLSTAKSSVADLKEQLQALLLAQPLGATAFNHVASQLLVLDYASAHELPDDLNLCTQGRVSVYEVFLNTPVDLYRTAQPIQVHPVVESDNGNAFSGVAPLLCAALRRDTEGHPYFHSDGGMAAVRGVSLRMEHCKTDGTVAPQDPVEPTEPKGMSRVDVNTLAPPCDPDAPLFGLLHTADVFESSVNAFASFNAKTRTKSAPGTANRSTETTKRQLYFCFKLPAHTDVGSVGAAVVLDNVGETGHFSLIPWPCTASPPLTVGLWRSRGEDNVLVRDPDPTAPPPVHPECFSAPIVGVVYQCLPFIAAKFCLHDMQLQAAAAPCVEDLPEDGPGSEQARILLRGASLLFEARFVCEPISVQRAIDALKSARFSLHVMPRHEMKVLHRALTELQLEGAAGEEDRQAALEELSRWLMTQPRGVRSGTRDHEGSGGRSAARC